MDEIVRTWTPGEIVSVVLAIGWLWRITTQQGAPPDSPRRSH